MAAYLIVRAVVPEADREKFDQWYQDVHLPEALSAFDATSAWRGSVSYTHLPLPTNAKV